MQVGPSEHSTESPDDVVVRTVTDAAGSPAEASHAAGSLVERSILLAIDGESACLLSAGLCSGKPQQRWDGAAAGSRGRGEPGSCKFDDELGSICASAAADHTLGNALRDVMWSHPHVQLASYTQEHPTSTEVLVRCQTSGAISAEQGVVEALEISKHMLAHMEDSMDAAFDAWQQEHQGQQQQQLPLRKSEATGMEEG